MYAISSVVSKFSLNVHNKNEFIGWIFKFFLIFKIFLNCAYVHASLPSRGIAWRSAILSHRCRAGNLKRWNMKKKQRLYKLARYHWAEDGEGKQQLELGFCTRNNIMYTAKINKRTLIYVHEHQLRGGGGRLHSDDKKKATNNGAAHRTYDREKSAANVQKLYTCLILHTSRRPSKDTR